MKKAISITALILAACLPANASWLSSMAGDLKEHSKIEVLSNFCPATFYDADNDIVMAGGLTSVYTYHNLSLQAGFLEPVEMGEGPTMPVASLSFFLGRYMSRHLSLPSDWVFLNRLHLGPFSAYNFNSKKWLYGVQASLKFGLGGAEEN